METRVLASFGDLLKTYRKQQGFTQQQLARKLDLHQNTIGAWERGDYLPATRGMILELARCLHLHEADALRLLEASLLAAMFYWGLPSPRNPFFTGRQDLLHQMHHLLSRTHNRASPRSCALSGMGGIGKTQTAIEYAYRYTRDYAAVLWVNAATEESLLQSFTSLAGLFKLLTPAPPSLEDTVTSVLSWLAFHRGWLLIFDNVRACAPIQRFVPASHHGALLFTTRLPTLGTLAPCLEVPPLSIEESVHLLLSRVQNATPHQQHPGPISNDDTPAVRAIAADMSGLPLALDLAAAYIEEAQCRCVEFLALARHNALQALQVHPSAAIYPYSVERTFTLAFAQLQQQNPTAADLLHICCLLAPEEIPEALLLQGAPYLNKALQAALSDPLTRHTIFTDLLTHALLHRNAHRETVRVHRVVLAVLQGQMPEDLQRIWIERLIHLLDHLFFTDDDLREAKNLAWNEQVLPHIRHVLHLAERRQVVSAGLASLLCKTATYLFQQAPETASLQSIFSPSGFPSLYERERHREAEGLALRALAICEQQQTPGLCALVGLVEKLTGQLAPGQATRGRVLPSRQPDPARATGWQAIPAVAETEICGNGEADACEAFLRECCTFSAQASCRTADLWQAYQAWVLTQEAEVSLSRQALTSRLKARGCAAARTSTTRTWHGLELKRRSPAEAHSVPAGGESGQVEEIKHSMDSYDSKNTARLCLPDRILKESG